MIKTTAGPKHQLRLRPDNYLSASDQAVLNNVTLRDKLKIRKRDGSWSDCYGRPASPHSRVCYKGPVSDVTFVGNLCSVDTLRDSQRIVVYGHLPQGEGHLQLDANRYLGVFRVVPGHPEVDVPVNVRSWGNVASLFWPTGKKESAGLLYVAIPLENGRDYEYTCDNMDIRTRIKVGDRPPSTAESMDTTSSK